MLFSYNLAKATINILYVYSKSVKVCKNAKILKKCLTKEEVSGKISKCSNEGQKKRKKKVEKT